MPRPTGRWRSRTWPATVDLWLVIGDRTSSATATVCARSALSSQGVPAHLILDEADEIDPAWLRWRVRTIGVTSGASHTGSVSVRAVVARLAAAGGDRTASKRSMAIEETVEFSPADAGSALRAVIQYAT